MRLHSARVRGDRTFDIIAVALAAVLLALAGIVIWWLRRRGGSGPRHGGSHRRLPSESASGLDSAAEGGFMDEEELGQVELLRRTHSEVTIRSEASEPTDKAPPSIEISVDEYAPQLSDLTEWLGAVVTEVVPIVAAEAMHTMKLRNGQVSPAPPPRSPTARSVPATPVSGLGDDHYEPALATGESTPAAPRLKSAIGPVVDAWEALLNIESEDGEAAQPGSIPSELVVGPLLDTFSASLNAIGEHLGAVMAPAVKHDLGNVEKVRARWEGFGRPRTLTALLQAEIASGIHQPRKTGMVLRDPSLAVATVWLRRSLAFQTSILDGIGTNRAASLSTIAMDAYRRELEKHHNWMLRSTFNVGLKATPAKEDFLAKVGAGLHDDDRETVVYEDLAALVRVQRSVLRAIARPLVDLDIDRSAADND